MKERERVVFLIFFGDAKCMTEEKAKMPVSVTFQVSLYHHSLIILLSLSFFHVLCLV